MHTKKQTSPSEPLIVTRYITVTKFPSAENVISRTSPHHPVHKKTFKHKYMYHKLACSIPILEIEPVLEDNLEHRN